MDDRARGSELCTSCGLCCTGSLHNAAVLDEDEIGAARALGLPVGERGGPVFSLPCPKLQDSVCTIYGSRPRVCGRYRCALLQSLEKGDIAFDEALSTVTTARKLAQEVVATTPGKTHPELRIVGTLSPDKAVSLVGGDLRDAMRLRVRVTAFEVYLDKHFRNPKDGKMFAMQRLDDDGTGNER